MSRLAPAFDPPREFTTMPHHGRLRFAIAILLAALPALNALAIGQNRDEKARPSEDELVARAAGRVSRIPTERDRLVRFLDRIAPRNGADAPSPNREFDDWFDRLADGQSTWDRATITRKPLTEVFDRMAERLNVTNGRLTRSQFHQYARKYLADGTSPPWDSADDQTQSAADKAFEQLDRNRDRVLSVEEQSSALRAGRVKWDGDRDGTVTRGEYRAYFTGRVREWQADRNNGTTTSGLARPAVYRAGKLPPDLPVWFARLDEDSDAQVALFEWRGSGWPIEDFRRLDRNDDGFLTADEVAWHATRAKEHETPEGAILARQLGATAATSSLSRDAKVERGNASDPSAKSPKQLKREDKAERRNDPERKDLKLKKKGDG
jgi:hypothetical protein